MTAPNTIPCSDYLMVGVDCSYDDEISVIPPTPPNIQREMNHTWHTPTSDYGSSGGSLYSPSLSDRSSGSPPLESRCSPGNPNSRLPPLDIPSSQPAQSFSAMSLSVASPNSNFSPALPSYQYPATLPTVNPEMDGGLSPLGFYSPLPSLPKLLESDIPSSFGTDDYEESILFRQHRPTFHILTEADRLDFTRGSSTSRARLDTSASTTTGTGWLPLPVPRRHSFNVQSPAGRFFPESEVASPDTPSPSSPFSSFSSSTSASQGSSPAGPPVHLHVGSPANVAASTSRRKKPAKFECMYCPATFTARHNLRNHLNAHAGVRPHLCPLCQYSFTTMAVMKRHQRKCKALPNVGPSFQLLHHQE
ncbi:hypothetical protein B0H11DRAFT_1368968 [Mycena galericulata]|nr:hypothetical protein B0H11DRAFT_1368968 [Mycena galericulata]